MTSLNLWATGHLKKKRRMVNDKSHLNRRFQTKEDFRSISLSSTLGANEDLEELVFVVGLNIKSSLSFRLIYHRLSFIIVPIFNRTTLQGLIYVDGNTGSKA